MLRAGTVDITEGVDPPNPTGIEALTPILEPLLCGSSASPRSR